MVHNKKGKVIMNSLPGCDADDIKNMTLLKFLNLEGRGVF